MQNKSDNQQFWNHRRNKIRSRKGGWRVGEGVFCHGYSMMEELVGEKTYMQVVVLNATGRMPSRPVADWLEALHICLSWPDARIWCNQIGALAGSSQTSPVAATCAGILGADSRAYGIKPQMESTAFIRNALSALNNGSTVTQIIDAEIARKGGKAVIMGYARPVAKGDERIGALERVREQLKIDCGPHLLLAFDIEEELHRRFGETMNVGGYMSAFLADQGYAPIEVYRILSFVVASGVTACYSEQYDSPPGAFLPLRCEDINYQGKAPRPVPEK